MIIVKCLWGLLRRLTLMTPKHRSKRRISGAIISLACNVPKEIVVKGFVSSEVAHCCNWTDASNCERPSYINTRSRGSYCADKTSIELDHAQPPKMRTLLIAQCSVNIIYQYTCYLNALNMPILKHTMNNYMFVRHHINLSINMH